MTKTLKTLLLSATSAALLAGCVLFPAPYQTTKHFDLGIPSKLGSRLEVSSVVMDGPYKRKMACRSNGNELVFDEYNSWASPPERMLERYLTMAFANGGDSKKKAKLNLSILVFELDKASNEAVLTVGYDLDAAGKKISARPTFRTKLEADTPKAFAAAMAKNAGTLAEELSKKF